ALRADDQADLLHPALRLRLSARLHAVRAHRHDADQRRPRASHGGHVAIPSANGRRGPARAPFRGRAGGADPALHGAGDAAARSDQNHGGAPRARRGASRRARRRVQELSRRASNERIHATGGGRVTAGTGGSGRTAALKRELGPFGAVMMGLGAMLGTGVFVSIGLGAGLAGPAVILALAIAAVVALCNGLSSAQLAAAYPVSGGTYEYGYRLLGPRAGFTAGWVFLIAKSTSAATAALGFAGYLLHALGLDPRHAVPVALGAIAALTAVVLAGIRRSNAANIAIVSVTVLALLF